MPTLKQLTCRLEWNDTGVPLDEFKTKYRDGQVETHIAVPEDPMPFRIHLTSRGYIAPGLAMFVYIDGEYQCNRNRHNLRIPDENTRRKHTEIEFLVKQKELMLTDGSLWGKPWRFEKIMVVPENIGELANCAPYDGEYLGTIEVIVLRCRNGPKSYPTHVSTTPVEQPARPVSYEANSKRAMVKPMAGESDPNPGLGMFLDGTVDTDATHSSKQLLGLDGNWDDQEPKSKPDDNQQWGWEMTGSETGEFKPISQGRYDSNKSSSKSRSSGDQSRADERGQIHASQSAPAGSPAVVINSRFILEDSLTYTNESVTHPAAGLQTEVRPTVRSVAPSNHSSRIRRGRKKHDKKGGKTSNDRGCESWKVPLPSTEASNADWTKPRHSSDTGSEVDWSPVDSKKDNKTAEWINSLSADDKDEGHDTGNDRGYWANDSSIRARRNTDSSQTRMRNNSRGERKLWNQGPDGHTNNRDSSGEWVGPNGSAKKDSGWNADKSRNETGRHLSWENEPKQSSPPVRTTITPAWAPIGHVSPKSPRLRSTSQLSQPFPGAWPRSRTPSPVRQEQTHKWSPPPDAVERLPMQPVRQEQTHRRPSLQDAVGRPQTEPVQPSWGGSTPEGPPKPMVGMGAELSSHHKSTGWSNMPLNVPAEMLHYPGNQIHNTPPASFAASRKLSLSRSMSRLGARSPSKITAKSRARSKSVARPRANTTASQDKSSKSPINKLLSELKDSKDLRSVFDPNATDSPLYTVPEEVIKRKDVTHQVNAGRTAAYFHRMSTPKYIDSHDDPYAVFVFKYRSKAALERMLNIEVIELEESERRRLMELSKDELIEQYLKAKAQADLKANIGNFDELDEATDKLDGIQLDQEEENDAPKGNDEAWGSWAGGGSTAGGWATDGQTVKSGNNGPSWGGNNEQNKNHANNSQGNGRLSWGGDDGRDRSRSTHHRSVHNSAGHGGNGPFAWGGDDEVNENHSNNGNSNGGLSWNGDNGRDRSRSTHYRSEHSGAGNGGNGHIAWGGDDEVNQTHSYNSQGNSGLSGPGKNGRDQSRSSQHRPVQGGAGHGGNAPLAWGGEQGRNQSQSSNGNTTTFRTASSNHGRYSSRDTNHRQNQGGGWAGDRDRSWGGETVNNGRRSDAGGNTGRVAEADVDW